MSCIGTGGLGRLWLVACWIIGVLAAGGLAQNPESALTSFEPEGKCLDWVVSAEDGRLFAAVVQDGGGAVIEFDAASGREIGRFAVGEAPAHLAIKGSTLVVGDLTSGRLDFFDLEKNKAAGQLLVDGTWMTSVFCSHVANPFVYASCAADHKARSSMVFQIDIEQRRVTGETSTKRWPKSDPADVAMSPDGRFLLFGSARTSPTGATLIKVSEAPFKMEVERSFHRTFGIKQAGDASRLWTMGGEVWPLDLVSHFPGGLRPSPISPHPPLRAFETDVLALHSTKNLAAGVRISGERRGPKQLSLSFFPLSGGDPLYTIPLGELAAEPYAEPSLPAYPVLSFDPGRDRLVFGYRNKGVAVDLSKLELPADPRVQLTLPRRIPAPVGEETRLKLELSDPALVRRAVFTLEKAPTEMKVEGDSLVWTPAESDVGLHEVVVVGAVGAVKDRTRVDMVVERSAVWLDGFLEAVSLSPDGRRALVLLSGVDAQRTLVLVDLETLGGLARKTVDREVSHILLGDVAAYYVLKAGNILIRAPTPDLVETGRHVLPLVPEVLHLMPANKIAVLGRSSVAMVDGDTLDGARLPEGFDSRAVSIRTGEVFAEPVNGAFRFGVHVLDHNTGESLYEVPTGGSVRPILPRRWSRRVNESGLTDALGMRLSEWERSPTVILNDHPLAVTARYSEVAIDERARHFQSELVLEMRNLVDGSMLSPIRLMRGARPKGATAGTSDYTSGKLLEIKAASDRVVVGLWNRLFVVDVPASESAAVPVPLHLTHGIALGELGIEVERELKFEASGGKGAMRYSLEDAHAGMTLDAESGVLRVDGAEAWAVISDALEKQGVRAIDSRLPRPFEANVTPDHFLLTATVKVADSEGAKDSLPISVKLLVGSDVVAPLLKPKSGPAPRRDPRSPFDRGKEDGETAAPSDKGNLKRAIRVADLELQLESVETAFENVEGQLAALRADLKQSQQSDEGAGKLGGWILVAVAALGVGFVLGRMLFTGGSQQKKKGGDVDEA